MKSSKKLASLLLSAAIGSSLSMTTAPAFAEKKAEGNSDKNVTTHPLHPKIA